MKKLLVNMSDSTYEKLKIESMLEKRSIQEVIADRILYKLFHYEVDMIFDRMIEEDIKKILNG